VEKLFVYFSICILTCLSCNKNNFEIDTSSIDILAIEKELENVNSIAEQKKYLGQLMEDDQELRQGQSSAIMLEYGHNSKEDIVFAKQQMLRDAENLIKTEKYFEKFGYPKLIEVGGREASAPWAVIHHSNTYETRKKYFGILQQAYLDGNIDDGLFSLYLGRMHRMKYGESLKMENPYRAEDEIKLLIEKLGLED